MSTNNYSKIKVFPNRDYQLSGPKSYVYLLQKWGFQPTLPGPYVHVDKVARQGLGFGFFRKIIGKNRTDSVLVKKEGPEEATPAAETREVPTEDMQYDSIYLSEVYVGTPPQKLLLNFDTGSADTWVRYSTICVKSKLILDRFGPPNSPQISRRPLATLSSIPKNPPRLRPRRSRLGRSHMAITPLRLELSARIT